MDVVKNIVLDIQNKENTLHVVSTSNIGCV